MGLTEAKTLPGTGGIVMVRDEPKEGYGIRPAPGKCCPDEPHCDCKKYTKKDLKELKESLKAKRRYIDRTTGILVVEWDDIIKEFKKVGL